MIILPHQGLIKPPPLHLAGMGGGMQSLDGVGQFPRFGGGGGGGPVVEPLGNLVASCVFDLDATVSASYPGSGQEFINYEGSPADSESATAYDFYRGNTSGASSDDPTYNAGPPPYFSFDGGDYFSLKSGTNTTFINALQKTTGGTDFWFAVAFRMVNSASSQTLFATRTTAAAVGFSATILSTDERIRLEQRGAATAVFDATGGLTGGTDYLLIVSIPAGGGTARTWINNRTASTGTFTYSATSSNAAVKMLIGVGATTLASTTRMYHFSMGNAYIDDTAAGLIFDQINFRTGITFA